MNLMQKMHKGNQKGMTLIELLGVIVIIGILFVVLNAAINASTDSAKLAGIKTDFRALQMGFEQQVRETGELPKNVDDINKYIDMEFDATSKKSDKSNPFGGNYLIEFNESGGVVTSVVITADTGGKLDAGEPTLTVTKDNRGNPLFETKNLGNELKTDWKSN